MVITYLRQSAGVRSDSKTVPTINGLDAWETLRDYITYYGH